MTHGHQAVFRTVAAALLASGALAAQAAPTIVFGEDIDALSAANMPNASAAQADFLSRLTNVGTQGFETFSAGFDFFANPGTVLGFGSTGTTAVLSGTVVQNDGFGKRFATDGSNYLNLFQNQRITFSRPVAAFGMFVTDANELDNDPATVTIGGATLTPAQIDARPFDSVDGIFRIVTERSPGVFELVFDGGTFPGGDGTAMYIGVLNAANPYNNLIFINGAAGLDGPFTDGFGYDTFSIGTPVPEPSTWALLGLGLLGVGVAARRRRTA